MAGVNTRVWTTRTTYEYQCGVQILVVFLEKIFIVLLGLLATMPVEVPANVPHGLWQVIFLAVRAFQKVLCWETKKSSPNR